MRILLDTNIFICREQDRVVSEDLTRLLQIFNEIHTEFVIHPLSIQELKNDSNENRKRVNLSKIQVYTHLEHPPDPDRDEEFKKLVGTPKGPHDKIDNALLFAAYKNAVDFFITEDRDIYKKSKRIALEDRVFIISEAVRFFSKWIPSKQTIYTSPALVEDSMHNLNLKDPIFNSLREDYPRFNQWFNEKAREGRNCFVNRRNDGSIGAVFIPKIEEEDISSTPPLPKKKRVKIATMKVTHVGNKIGELILKIAVKIALNNGISEIYLTTFPKHQQLVDLICEYGFRKKGILQRPNGAEDVYIKSLYTTNEDISKLSPVQISQKYYPSYYDGDPVKKFLIPIQPIFHDRLFADYPKGRQLTLFDHSGHQHGEGNTIKKAYLTRSKIKKIRSGDIVLFYRSKDLQQITSLGIVDQFFSSILDSNEIMRIIGKRSVYSNEDIVGLKKPVSIILFRHHLYLKNEISLNDLMKQAILLGPPQSIVEINDQKYSWIKKHGDIDENLTLH
jgi:hypothetical protein